ncbi:MAG: hypothetical protein RR056_02150 [Acetivibrio sp.]
MIKRKRKFLTFCFSCLPGAGHMYLGFMKQGISIMTLFFGICFVATMLNMGPILFVLPVLWFYSFFDTHNKNSMSDEDFYKIHDEYLFNMNFSELQLLLQGKFRIIIAVVCMLMGVGLLFSNFTSLLYQFLPYENYAYIDHFLNKVPQIILAVFIILVGIRLIKGKQSDLAQQIEEEEKHEDA